MKTTNLENVIKRCMAGEPLPRHNEPALASILAELRAAIHDREAQRAIGWFVIQQLASGLKASIHGEKALAHIMNKECPDD